VPISDPNSRLAPGVPHRPPAAPAAPPAPPAAGGTAATDASGLVAGQPAEAVVAEGQLEDAVVLRTADERAGRSGRERDSRDPPASCRDHRRAGDEQLPDPPAHTDWCRHQIDKRERRDDEQRLQHLREEGEPDEGARERQPAGRACVQ